MIADAVLFLVISSLGMLAGVQLHESAHYLVLKIAGRSPTMHLPSLADGRISARVEFDLPDDQIPADIRLAAVAPLLAALALALPLIVVAMATQPLGIGFAVGALIWTARLSPKDRQVALNRANTAK
jgi:multisubunit Na+/H+ antiporter MnhC subunit